MAPFRSIGRGLRRLKDGLSRTRGVFRQLLTTEDDDEFEGLLLGADVGIEATRLLVSRARGSAGDRREVLEREITRLLDRGVPVVPPADVKPRVVMIVGVNGSGKTTSVGKLCCRFREEGKSVVLAAADTYRDAASEQLGIWAERAGVEMVSSIKGQDAASVAFDAISKGVSRGSDVVLVDTAGRLHTRRDLMDEVVKIKRVCGKVREGSPDDIWIVLDATVGQNGLHQARVFNEHLGLTGVIVAKLDGTAKGGILIPIVLELGLPICYVGTGEGLEDLASFDPQVYARALFED